MKIVLVQRKKHTKNQCKGCYYDSILSYFLRMFGFRKCPDAYNKKGEYDCMRGRDGQLHKKTMIFKKVKGKK